MAAITSLSFSAITQSFEKKISFPSSVRSVVSNYDAFRVRSISVKTSNLNKGFVVHCMSTGSGNFLFTFYMFLMP